MSFEIEPGTKFVKNILVKTGNILRVGHIKENTDGGSVDVSGVEMKNSALYLPEQEQTSTPLSGKRMLFFETDGNLAMKDSSGTIDKVRVPKNKGEIVTHNGTEQVILPGGSEFQVLSVDPSSSTGFSWKNPENFIEQYQIFTLIDTMWTSIDIEIEGGRQYSIVNEVAYGPCGMGFLTKSEQEEKAHCFYMNCPGENDERLVVRWTPDHEMEIQKNIDTKNGSYIRRILTRNKDKTTTLSNTDYTEIFSEISGNLLVIIEPDHNTNDGGPCSIFLLTKSEQTNYASIVCLSASPSVFSNEKLEIRWQPNTGVELKKDGENYDGIFNIKPLMKMVRDSGIVSLSGINYVNIYKKKDRLSMLLVVKNVITNGPSAVFAILKNDKTQQGLVQRLTSCPGSNGEHLEVTYAANSKVKIRKTGVGFDGDYNFSIL